MYELLYKRDVELNVKKYYIYNYMSEVPYLK